MTDLHLITGGRDEEELSFPPYPDPKNTMLQQLFDHAKLQLDRGDSIESVISWAIPTAWMEGHLHGHECDGNVEDEVPGGTMKIRRAMWEGRKPVTQEKAEEIASQLGIQPAYWAKKYGFVILPPE